jgi:hypothetical protein
MKPVKLLHFVLSMVAPDTRWIHWLFAFPSKDSAQNLRFLDDFYLFKDDS